MKTLTLALICLMGVTPAIAENSEVKKLSQVEMFELTDINKPASDVPPTPATIACNELNSKFEKLCKDTNNANECQLKKSNQIDEVLQMIPPHNTFYISAKKDLMALKSDKELSFDKVTRLISNQDCGSLRYSRTWKALELNSARLSQKQKEQISALLQATVLELKEKPAFLYTLLMTTAAIKLGEQKVLPLNADDIDKLKALKKELHESKKLVNAGFIATVDSVSKTIHSKRKSKEDMNPLSPKEEAVEARKLLNQIESEYNVALPYIERLSKIIEDANSRK